MNLKIRILRTPIIVIIVNFVIFALIPGDLTDIVGDVIYNLVRFLAIVYAGWLVVRQGGGGILTAAYVGLLLFAFDHIILKGGKYLIIDTLFYNDSFQQSVNAFVGVLISFVMWCALPIALSCVGGLIGKIINKRRS